MDIRVLQYFLAVAREENITRAAESLHISQPSLSKQLMDLESELGKTLLIRGKRRVTLTEDGILLRKRADEIVTLFEKTKHEMSTDNEKISGVVSVGGNPTITILNIAANIRESNPDISFNFYSSDAIDVAERLEHGILDFAIFLEPVDAVKYDYISLPDSSVWGLLLPKNSVIAKKESVQKEDLLSVPLIFHRRAGLQKLISHWAQTETENLNVAATYNVINGSPCNFVKSGLGCYVTTEDLLPKVFEESVCFRPFEPPLEIHYALVWKRYAVFSKASELFLKRIKNLNTSKMITAEQ